MKRAVAVVITSLGIGFLSGFSGSAQTPAGAPTFAASLLARRCRTAGRRTGRRRCRRFRIRLILHRPRRGRREKRHAVFRRARVRLRIVRRCRQSSVSLGRPSAGYE
jgi:hypothetical protein